MIRKEKMGFLAFLPLIFLFLAYVVVAIIKGTGGTFSLQTVSALIIALIIALLMGPQKFDDKVDIFCQAVANPGLSLTILIFMCSGIFSKVATEMGAVDSIVNLILQFAPPHLLYAGVFTVSAFLSLCIGTSVGTCTAMVPLALGLCETVGLDYNIAFAAVLAGALFGDNLSMISDTTIAATKGVGAEMKDKFRMNFLIVLPAAIVTAVIFGAIGMGSDISTASIEIGGYSLIKILPYLYVLIAALAGMNVLIVLLSATGFAGIVGLMTSTITFQSFLNLLTDGVTKMASAIAMIILVTGIMGLVRAYGGVEWLTEKLAGSVKSKKGAEYSIFALSGTLVLAMANTTMAIITAVPLAKEIADKYSISPKRTACLLDLGSTTLQGFVFYGGFYPIIMNLAGCGELWSIYRHCYYFIAVFVMAMLSIHFGLFTGEKKNKN